MLDFIYKFSDHQQSMPAIRLRNIFIYFTSSLALVCVTLLISIGAIELALRATKHSSFLAYQPCLYVKWSDEFFSYRSNCDSWHGTENGLVHYHFNELGLRDRSVSSFGQGAIVFLGDSITKGLFLREEQTIPRLLESRIEPRFPIFNAGVRYASPTTESLLYRKLKKQIPIKAVILFVNGSDIIDERLYAGLAVQFDENGVPVEFSGSTPMNPMRPNPIYEALKRFNSKFYFIELIRQWTYFTRLAGIVKTTDPENTNFCKSIDRLRRETDRDHIPFMVVATPLMPRGIENIWPGIKFDPQELEKMMACVKKKGIETVDLSGVPVRESWYTRDQLHSSPEGAEVIAKSVEAAIKNFFHRFNLLKKPLLPAAHRP